MPLWPLFLLPLAPLLGLWIGWLMSETEWDVAFRCAECGHTSRYNRDYGGHHPCKGCGEPSKRVRVIRRGGFIPFTWIEK